MIIASQFLVPYLPLVSPQPIISGYIGYYAGILTLCLIPMILIARSGFGLIWNHKFDPKIRRMLLGTWMVSFIVFTATATFGARNFAYRSSTKSSIYNGPIDRDKPFIIEIDQLDSETFDNRIQLDFGHSKLDNGILYVDHGLNFRISPTEDQNLTVNAIDISRGSSPQKAKENTEIVQHETKIEQNRINIDEYYSLARKSKFRGQYRMIEMQVPIGQNISLEGSSHPFSSRDFKGNSPQKMKNWTMTAEGLKEKIDVQNIE